MNQNLLFTLLSYSSGRDKAVAIHICESKVFMYGGKQHILANNGHGLGTKQQKGILGNFLWMALLLVPDFTSVNHSRVVGAYANLLSM